MAEMRLDICMTDLTPEAQDRVRKFYGIPDGEYDNFDIFPLACLWKEVSDEEAEAACGLRRSNYEPDDEDEDEDKFDKFFCGDTSLTLSEFEELTDRLGEDEDEDRLFCFGKSATLEEANELSDDLNFLADLQAEQSEQG